MAVGGVLRETECCQEPTGPEAFFLECKPSTKEKEEEDGAFT